MELFTTSKLVDTFDKTKYDPQRPLLVLDVDQALLHAFVSHDPNESFSNTLWVSYEEPNLYNKFRDTYYHFVLRPHFHYFLNEAKKHYQLALWSNSPNDYVNNVYTHAFNDYHDDLLFVFSRTRSAKAEKKSLNYNSGGQYDYLKDLIKLKRRGVDLKRTLAVDDLPKNFRRHYGNVVRLEPFVGDNDNDTELLRLLDYLVDVKDTENFRELEKRGWQNYY